MIPKFGSFRKSALLCGLLLMGLIGSRTRVAEAQIVPSSPASGETALPLNFARSTGDLDDMEKRQTIRALVMYSRSGFFYVNGRPQGIYYEALNAFQQFVNEKLKAKRQHVEVTFIPVQAPTRWRRP